MNLYSEPMTQKQIAALLNAKGSELAAKIKELRCAKKIICRLQFKEPSKSSKRIRIYQFIAQQTNLEIQ